MTCIPLPLIDIICQFSHRFLVPVKNRFFQQGVEDHPKYDQRILFAQVGDEKKDENFGKEKLLAL